jgi:outer membrane protein
VIGNPPSNLVDQRPPERLLPRALPEAIQIAQKEAPTVVNAFYNEQAARHTVDLIWGELLPTVTLDGTYSRRFDTNRLVDETESTTVTGRLNVPIYPGGGEVYARVRQAKHTHVQRLQDVETQRTLAQEAAVAAWSNYQAAKAQLQANETSVRGARTALAGVREEERVGQRTLLDVLNAERDLVQAEVQLVQTQRDHVVQAYTLLQAIGRLNVAELGVTEKVYDATIHYFEVRRQWWGISITHPNGRKEQLELWDTHGEKHESSLK